MLQPLSASAYMDGFLQPPPSSHLLYFHPSLYSQPKGFDVKQPRFSAQFGPLPVGALGQVTRSEPQLPCEKTGLY